MKAKWNCTLPLALMLVFAVTRWPGMLPENFSAAYALAFCAGVYFPRRLAWWLPLGTLLATDIVLNAFYYHTELLSRYQLVNYAVYVVLIRAGQWFKARDSWWKLLGGGLGGAVLFYLITNTAAWLQSPVYAKNLAGWIQALTTGEPGYPPTWQFFLHTLLSGGLFTGLFVGAMKVSMAVEPKEVEAPAEPAAEEEDGGAKPEEAKA